MQDKVNKNKEERDNIFLEILNYICSKLFYFFNKIINCLSFGCNYCNYFCYIIIILLILYCLLYFLFCHIINSFHLDKSKEYLNNPRTYSNLLKYLNISHIAKVMKITNSTKNIRKQRGFYK